MSRSSNTLAATRRKARRLALQALYQWQIAQTDITHLQQQFLQDTDLAGVDVDYLRELICTVPAQVDALDLRIEPYLDRALSSLTPIELAVLRIGTYELLHRLDIPYRVVINEGIELSKTFGASQAHRYINGVLDQLAKAIRIDETA